MTPTNATRNSQLAIRMSDETHYQILGIRRRASIEVIEAAYQRLQRLNQGEYVPVLPGAVVDETSDQARWRRIQLAYDILSSPVHRPIYDDKLWREERFGPKPAKKAPSRKFLDPLGAWLSSQKRADGFLFFRVGWSADFGKTQAELEKNIPAEDRLYSPETGQWRIVDRYDDLLDELFDNFERADQPPPKDLPRPIYQRKGIIPTIRRTWEPWTGWPLVLIAGLVVSIGATLIFPANRQADLAAQATATAAVAVNAVRTFNDPVITPSRPSSLPPLAVVTATLAFPSVNLRSGPGIDFPSLVLLDNQQEYILLGRTVDNAWLVLSSGAPEGADVGWIAAFAVTSTVPIDTLPLFGAEDPLPGVLPTPTLEPPRPP